MVVTRKLIPIHHGEPTWNLESRFTGWVDVDLINTGVAQARRGDKLLREVGFTFDLTYTSVFKHAIRTLWHVQDETDLMWILTRSEWRLSERHYGALSGSNKAETATQYGGEQVLVWRHSCDTPSLALELGADNDALGNPRYAGLTCERVPLTECLKDTVTRVMPLWEESVAPAIKNDKRVVIAAHGNSIRVLVEYLDSISDTDVVGLNTPNDTPLVYEPDTNLKPIHHYYLGDQEVIAASFAAVASQGKSK